MFQLVKIIDSSAPHQGDIRCFKKMGVKQYDFFIEKISNKLYIILVTYRLCKILAGLST